MGASDRIHLRGMAWDHPRGKDPLRAVSDTWVRHHPAAAVSWDARPLKDFEDQALEDLAAAYDLVLIDHPFTQTAADSGLVSAVDDWVSPAYLEDQRAHSVGPSFASYGWAGKQWALAIDAACQVDAVREDLRAAAGLDTLPGTWAEVGALAARLAGGPARVAVPLNPNHGYCAFLSVGVTLAGDGFWRPGQYPDEAAGAEALECLRELAADLHPDSRLCDPIGVSDRMSRTDEIVYVPLMFGYSSYVRPGFRPHTLRFGNAPSGPSGRRGTVLGGVGLALSARSEQAEQAADLARCIAAPETQSGLYVESGGQPGHAAAWGSPRANRQVGDFFRRTLESMEQAFIRPCISGHRPFQPRAGELIHRFIWGSDMSATACLQEFNRLCDTWLGDWE
jgi:multiple sugar transport system substrate-binding protein